MRDVILLFPHIENYLFFSACEIIPQSNRKGFTPNYLFMF